MVRLVLEALLEALAEVLHFLHRRIHRQADVADHAIRRLGRELDRLLAEQRGVADERALEALLARLAHDARAFLLVAVDEHGVGVRGLELDHVGGEVDLPRLGRHVGGELDVARLQFLDQPVAAALAEVVVDPDEGDALRLQLVADVVRDLRHADLLAERGAEHVRVAERDQLGRLAADELRHLGLLDHLQRDLDVARQHRPEDHVRLAVDRLLHLRARDPGVGLRVVERQIELLPEHAAAGVDLLDREDDAVAEVAARDRELPGDLADIGELHLRGCSTPQEHRGKREYPSHWFHDPSSAGNSIMRPREVISV